MPKSKKSPYQRILLKVSGEAFMAPTKGGIDPAATLELAQQIAALQKGGREMAVVIGGGNLVRGRAASTLQIPREKADAMGMLATVLNGIMLCETLLRLQCPAVLRSAFPCGSFVEVVQEAEIETHLLQGTVVIFGGGTGHPYLTTDTAAALRACEIRADVLIKGTKVDGIFYRDPTEHQKARHLPKLTYNEVLVNHPQLMDGAAVALCREHRIPIHVLNIFKKEALKTAVRTQQGGSIVQGD